MIRKLAVTLAVGVALAVASQFTFARTQADDRVVLTGIKEFTVAFDVLEGDAKLDEMSRAPGVASVEQRSVAIRQQETQGRERAACGQGREQQLDFADGLPVARLRRHPAVGEPG